MSMINDNIIERIEELDSLLSSLEDNNCKVLNSEIVIFGAGNTSLLYQSCIENENIVPQYFCDNSVEKQGTKFLGKEVISPKEIKSKLEKPFVLICSAIPEICIAMKAQCEELGLEACMLDEIVFFRHKKEIMDNYVNLADTESRKVYASIIKARIYGLDVEEELYNDNQYYAFTAFLKRRMNEVFVDCGAYVGDSIEKYIWKKDGCFHKIYAFEPDSINYNRMQTRVDRLNKEWGFETTKINLIQGGVGEKTTKLFVENASVASKISSEGDDCTDIWALDEYFKDIKVSFLKADIESYELNMIEGAKKIIKRDKPLIAVTIYHNAKDMYYIMQQIRKINPEYKFGIRHHAVEFCETVLYAW